MADSSWRNQRNNPYVLDGLAVGFHRSAAGVLWRWRTELAVLGAVGAGTWSLAQMVTITLALVITGSVLVVLAVLPWSRRYLASRAWCVLARHRLQRLCYETRLHTRTGRLSLILWIRPTKVGERAHVLCRAGICAEDFEAHIGEIRAACYAREARVSRNPRWSQLVTVDIIRHDTLAAARTVPSTLMGAGDQHRPALPGHAPEEAA